MGGQWYVRLVVLLEVSGMGGKWYVRSVVWEVSGTGQLVKVCCMIVHLQHITSKFCWVGDSHVIGTLFQEIELLV